MKDRTVAETISTTAMALSTCREYENKGWAAAWARALDMLARNYLPHGSGFDSGCRVDHTKTGADKIVLYAEFHCMNDVGFYDGWREYRVTVRPTFGADLDVTISGRDYRDTGLPDYVAERIRDAMNATIPDDAWRALVDKCRGEG